MDKKQKELVTELRNKGKSWKACAAAIGLPTSTVYSYFKRRTTPGSAKARKARTVKSSWEEQVLVVMSLDINSSNKLKLVRMITQ